MSAIDIWRTDVADAVLEVDGKCNVKQASLDACVLFGYPASGMKSTNLSRLFQMKSGGSDPQHNTLYLSGCSCFFCYLLLDQNAHAAGHKAAASHD